MVSDDCRMAETSGALRFTNEGCFCGGQGVGNWKKANSVGEAQICITGVKNRCVF